MYCFVCFVFVFIEVSLIYGVVFVSGVHQCESVMHIHMFTLSDPFPM